MIKIIDGDILDASEDIIGHQVNCTGAMKSGVAKFIRGKYPEIFEPYYTLCKSVISSELLGNCQLVNCHDGKSVANLFGQGSYGYDGAQYTSVPHLRAALQSLKNVAKLTGKSVAIPYKIGSCRGGADWNEVYTVIDQVFSDYEVTLYRKDLG